VKSRARDRFRFAGYEVTGTVVTKYIHVGNKTLAAKKGGEKLFYHNDHLGGVNVITDINGLVAQLIEYDPWGKISRSEGGGEGIIRFTGQKLDVESGLLYYGGRYYDPELGRFISPDPFVPEMFNPQSLNRYAYVNNNPVNYVDPSGYFHRHKINKSSGFFGTIFDAIIGFILGGLAGALFGAALAQLPPEVFHGLEIFGGIAMLLTGNPAGIAFIAQGALGFCKEQSCQYASAGFGLVGGAALGVPSGGEGFSEAGGAGGFGNDFPVPESPSLGGMGGQALISVAKTIDNQ
jgi:RHS repeat-associated protein